jgi:hypothetical protein
MLTAVDDNSGAREQGGVPVGLFEARRSDGSRWLEGAKRWQLEPATDIAWLWPGKIPTGEVTVIEGEPGVGKSFVALDFVARVTAGIPWPAVVPLATAAPQPQPAQVLLVSRGDDDPTINRRLAALGVAASRVARLGVVVSCRSDRETGERRPLELPFDLPMLRHELEVMPSIRLVVIDPLSEFCETPKRLRKALRELNELAQEFDVAIVVTLPARCRFDVRGVLRVTSRFPTEVARCVWCVVADPDNPARRLFVARRTNSFVEPQGLPFHLHEGRVVWNPAVSLDPTDPLGQEAAIRDCVATLLEEGIRRSSEVFRLGAQLGFTPQQMRGVAQSERNPAQGTQASSARAAQKRCPQRATLKRRNDCFDTASRAGLSHRYPGEEQNETCAPSTVLRDELRQNLLELSSSVSIHPDSAGINPAARWGVSLTVDLPQQFFDDGAQIIAADVDLRNVSFAIDQEQGGNRADFEAAADGAFRRFVHRHSPRKFGPGAICFHSGRAVVEADADDVESLLVKIPVDLFEIRKLGQARSAGRPPEIDEHDAVRVIGGIDPLPLQVARAEARSGLADQLLPRDSTLDDLADLLIQRIRGRNPFENLARTGEVSVHSRQGPKATRPDRAPERETETGLRANKRRRRSPPRLVCRRGPAPGTAPAGPARATSGRDRVV